MERKDHERFEKGYETGHMEYSRFKDQKNREVNKSVESKRWVTLVIHKRLKKIY